LTTEETLLSVGRQAGRLNRLPRQMLTAPASPGSNWRLGAARGVDKGLLFARRRYSSN
jgi:hypothetical protein